MSNDNDWRKEIACILNELKDCVSETPEACACKKMPPHIYRWYLNDLEAKGFSVGVDSDHPAE